MKKIYLLIAALVTTSLCSYGSIAFDDSSDSAYADNWQGSDNGGYGFNPWTIASSGSAGIYINSDTPGEKGFRTWSNPGYYVSTSRSFNSSLNAGEMFSMNLGHFGGNDGELRISILADSSPILELTLTAGNSSWRAWDGEDYDLNDGNGFADYFTTDNKNAEFTFTYNGGTSYGFSLTDGAGNGYNLDSKEGTSMPAAMGSINRISIGNYGQGSGNNFYVDNLQIEVIPEPATIGLFGLVGATGIFIRRKFAV